MTTRYILTCLSPVHIGTGTNLTRFDGAYENGRWYVVDLDAVFARGVDGNELAQVMNAKDFAWASWLKGRGMRAEQVAAYSLPCPQDPRDVAVREGMKDIYNQPYVPGTTLKGAIRTAILWHLLHNDQKLRTFTERYLLLAIYSKDILHELRKKAHSDKNLEKDPGIQQKAIHDALNLDSMQEAEEFLYLLRQIRGRQNLDTRDFEQLGRDKSYLGRPIEQHVLGADPNHDLMRAVRVIDSQPIGLDAMEVGLVWTYTLRNGRMVEKHESDGEYKAFAEWLKPESRLHTRVELDDYLLGKAGQELGFSPSGVQAVRNLARVCNDYALALVKKEREFASRYQLSAFQRFYTDLQNRMANLPQGAYVLRIGWGGGWDTKTVGDIVEEILPEEDFEELREKYGMGEKPGTKQIDWNAPFPKTRLVAYRNGVPFAPMGWVLLEPEPNA